ncbi:MAG: 50S ribosomal protein L22 [Nanoarchaeota archaeon]
MELQESQKTAEVHGKDLPVSTKQSIEIASFIRNRSVNKAISLLSQVLEKKIAVPFRRFKRDIGHKPGKTGPGRYPQKASETMISLLKSLVANGQNKGMDTNSLIIRTIMANKASRPFRYGRKRRIQARRTHIDIIAVERKYIEKKNEKKSEGAGK